MDLSRMTRPEVRHFEPYLPGKPIEEVQAEFGLKKVVKLASNENAIGTSAKAVKAVQAGAKSAFRYPEGPGTLLRKALAKKLGVSEAEIILGAGSDEIIEILGKTFFNKGDEIIVSKHAFTRYKMAGDLMGITTLETPMKDMKHDLKAMAGMVNSRTKAIFIANPNNPTGTYASRAEVEEFFSLLKSRDSNPETAPFVVFDEAYFEFAKEMAHDYPDSLDYFRNGLNLATLRTFSKAHGLAGLRVGYGVAQKEAVAVMDRVRPPFNVSNAAQAAALAALADAAHIKKSVRCVKSGMKFLVKEIEKLNLPYLRSAGNFLLIDVSPRKGKEIFRALLEKGVIVRAVEEYGLPDHVRVTVGLPEENKFFINKLKECIQ